VSVHAGVQRSCMSVIEMTMTSKKTAGVGKADDIVGLTLLLAVVGVKERMCDNVKCANKNGRCCANVGGRGVCVDAKRGAWTTTLWAETFARTSDVPRRTGAVARQ
jgi:hypothetical protein